MILKTDGSVWTTGNNKYGQLGDGTKGSKKTYVKVIDGGVKAIAAGDKHSLALKTDGSLWAVGSDEYGQFGDKSSAAHRSVSSSKRMYTKFTKVIDSGVLDMCAGVYHSMVVKADGVYGAGTMTHGQLGFSKEQNKKLTGCTRPAWSCNLPLSHFEKSLDATGIKGITCPGDTTFVLKKDGDLFATGNNYAGQLGIKFGKKDNPFGWVKVAHDVQEVTEGVSISTHFRKTDGSIWAAGHNGDGLLGLGTTSTSRNTIFQEVANIL